jgi:hypothetical protein
MAIRSPRPFCLTKPLCLVLALTAQGGRRFGGDYSPNLGYNGQFVYTRIKFDPGDGEYGRRWGDVKWDHDYPASDMHFPRIIRGITSVSTAVKGSNIYTFDDPDLFRFPFVYLCEPGFLTLNDREVSNARAYLLKGGFILFDDFVDEQWDNFESEMKRILPDARPIELDVDHPIFHSFFNMKRIDFPHPYRQVLPHYYGIFENNDPTKRMMAIVNYDNDVSEYWEWSDTDEMPADITNEAYKLGVNYLVYSMTH